MKIAPSRPMCAICMHSVQNDGHSKTTFNLRNFVSTLTYLMLSTVTGQIKYNQIPQFKNSKLL